MEILQELYNSEINASIAWNWDGGIEVRIGNGLYLEEDNWEAGTNVPTIEEAVEWLKNKAFEIYPDSEFTKKAR